MSHLQIKPDRNDKSGCLQRITPQSAGWKYVGFEQHTLAEGQTLQVAASAREHCVVILSGIADIDAGSLSATSVGKRMSVSEHTKPVSVYAPAHTGISISARTVLEIAICSAPGGGDYQSRVIADDDVGYSVRGEGSNTRYIYDILPDNVDWAHSLLVVEVRTPAGNWSSYPPHRHDEDNLPEQSLLEETYYHRIFPSQGFAFQRVYNDDGSLDETMSITDGDVVLVPSGYHPYGVPYGYEGYYLNVMAGPVRRWQFYNHPDYAHLIKT